MNTQRLIIHGVGGQTEQIPLVGKITLGRSSACQLCYPDDIGLSRQHLAISEVNGLWHVEDLGSKNGTLLNDGPVQGVMPFRPGDKIYAGHLTLELGDMSGLAEHKVEFVEQQEKDTTTVVADLDTVLGPETSELDKTSVFQGASQVRALIRAGRELAGHRPLNELFEVIMDLSMEAVLAGRGVLMTLEGEKLQVKAARGAGFKISSMVRDRVLKDKESLLVRDAQMDNSLREQKSIVLQRVRSFIAVPLQTQDRVIGLIYVDSPDLIREFTREDLGLLTVMANVAAIRIEHARLNEVEAMERALAKELEQAAQIQMGLLPTESPKVAGMDIAGKTLASRTVGGDYFDYLTFPDGRVGMIVGDVAGKGMPASLLESSLQARVQVVFADGDNLAEKINRVNKATAASCPDNRFITFFMTVANPVTGELVFCNAGHNPPLLVRAAGDFTELKGGGVMLGILPAYKYQEFREHMSPGDVLVLYTDGVTEASNAAGDEFGEEKLCALVTSLRDRPAGEIVDAIHNAVFEFAQGVPQGDDITVVVARKV